MAMEEGRSERYTERLRQQAVMKQGAGERELQICRDAMYKGMVLRQKVEEGKAGGGEGLQGLAAATDIHERHWMRHRSPAGAPATGTRLRLPG